MTAATTPTPASEAGPEPRCSVLAAGFLHPDLRRAIQEGEAPRVDVLEMEARLGWRLFDFCWLQEQERRHRTLRIAGRLCKRTLGWGWWLAIASWPLTRGDDAIYCTGEDVSLPAAILRRLTRGKPRLVTRLEQVTIGSRRWKRRLYQRLFRFAYPAINQILCRTRAQIDEIAALGLPAAKAAFVPEPTDTRFFSPDRAASDERIPGIPEGPYLLSAGLELRDYETLVEATRDMDIAVVIAAGSPWSRFGPGSVASAPPGNLFVRAFSRSEMHRLYRHASLVVVPVKPTTRACGMNVILEAWSMERPVIASKTAGLQSYITGGETAVFVPPGDDNELTAAVHAAMSNADFARMLAQNGRIRATLCHELDDYLGSLEMYMGGSNRQRQRGMSAKSKDHSRPRSG